MFEMTTAWNAPGRRAGAPSFVLREAVSPGAALSNAAEPGDSLAESPDCALARSGAFRFPISPAPVISRDVARELETFVDLASNGPAEGTSCSASPTTTSTTVAAYRPWVNRTDRGRDVMIRRSQRVPATEASTTDAGCRHPSASARLPAARPRSTASLHARSAKEAR